MRSGIGHKSSRFKFRFNLYNLIVFLLIVAVMASSFYLFTLINNQLNQTNTPSTPKEIEITTEEKPILKWWNMGWQSAYRIKIVNPTYEELSLGSYSQFVFNHKELVDNNKSKSDGQDLRLVFQDSNNKLIPINFNAESLNSESANISFKLAENLPKRFTTQRYYLYFNSENTEVNSFIIPKTETISSVTIAELDETMSKAFNFTIARKWYLKGNNLPEKFRVLNASLQVNPSFEYNDRVVLTEVEGTSLKSSSSSIKNNTANVALDVSILNPGTYRLKLKIDDYESTYPFFVSYPLYATWTMDWEGFDVKDEYLGYLDEIANTNGMPITHYFNPRIYISSSITPARRTYLTNWVKERKASRGDEISMHLHMFFDFVEAAGVPKRTEVTWGGGNDGYDVLTASYPPEEFQKIVEYALKKFRENGLTQPVGYRAGGWFINTDNLRVLANLGFKYDSSGREYYVFGKNKVKGFWNLKPTTRPYKMSLNDQNSSKPPTMNLWEFPNNGSESTNLKETEMLKKLNENFKGQPLNDKQVITFLSHPHWFNQDNPRIRALFLEMNKYKAENDGGPIIYTTLEEAYKIYSTQN